MRRNPLAIEWRENVTKDPYPQLIAEMFAGLNTYLGRVLKVDAAAERMGLNAHS
jgi:hypothetical protein